MRENCDLKVPILGASAGSLTGSCYLNDVDFDHALRRAIDISIEQRVADRKAGLVGILGSLVETWLNDIIPENISTSTSTQLHVAVTPVLKYASLSPYCVSGFQSKSDLVSALMASCHVPMFMDGKPSIQYRGDQVIDGSFWYFVTKDRTKGLPLLPGMQSDDVFWVDYGDDEDFMQTFSGNFLEACSPAALKDMMEYGYNFMKREHYYGRLPMATRSKPNFAVVNFFNGIRAVPTSAIRAVAPFSGGLVPSQLSQK
jgi:hypothetical protein